MDALSILILIIAAAGIIFGWRSGFIAQIGKFAGLIAAVIACRLFGQRFAVWMVNSNCSPGDSFDGATFWTIIAYLLIFIVVYLIVILLSVSLRKLIHAVLTGFIDRLCGALFRLTVYMIFVSFALNMWLVLFPADNVKNNPVASATIPVIDISILSLAPRIIGSEATMDIMRSLNDLCPDENT